MSDFKPGEQVIWFHRMNRTRVETIVPAKFVKYGRTGRVVIQFTDNLGMETKRNVHTERVEKPRR